MKVQVLYQNIKCFLESLVAPQGHGWLPGAAKRAPRVFMLWLAAHKAQHVARETLSALIAGCAEH